MLYTFCVTHVRCVKLIFKNLNGILGSSATAIFYQSECRCLVITIMHPCYICCSSSNRNYWISLARIKACIISYLNIFILKILNSSPLVSKNKSTLVFNWLGISYIKSQQSRKCSLFHQILHLFDIKESGLLSISKGIHLIPGLRGTHVLNLNL